MAVFSSSTIIQFGYLGVEFFFMISGFAIALTLKHTNSFVDFTVKRFARLFPAMLVCASITFLAAKLFQVEPFSHVQFIDFLPSLTFLSPQIFNRLFDIDSDWISRVYWSLFIEVKFYFIAAFTYFLFRTSFLISFSVLCIILTGIYWFAAQLDYDVVLDILTLVFFPKHVGLFIAGMGFYEVYSRGGKSTPIITIIIVASLAYSMFIYSPLNAVQPSSVVALLIIVVFHLLFVLLVIDSSMLAPLKSLVLAKIGAASYSLYLLHQGIGVPAIKRLNELVLTSTLWPFLVTVLMILLSIVIYDYIEKPSRRGIRKWYESHLSGQA